MRDLNEPLPDKDQRAAQPVSKIQIKTEDLGKRYNREWIYRKLNFTFKPGETYAITGPNGSGKSTLLQVLWGQTPPSAGRITYTENDTAIPVESIYKHISVAAPYMDLIDEFTLEEQLNFHFSLRKRRDGLSTEEMLDNMYLTHARNKFIANFSSGMKQRVKLALAFYSDADILFLDEPGTNLDRQAFDWYGLQLQTRSPHPLTFIASNDPREYPDNAQILNIMDYK